MKRNSNQLNNIIYWVLTGLVAFIFLGSAISKFTANEEALKMASQFGLDAKTNTLLGIIEVICLILFIVPRTGIIGTLLLASYMGGAIATHLEHGISVVAPCVIETFVVVVAIYRFPELRSRILKTKS
jgi:uncharacterized membrane protein YphA (DoxX/SURF4 family)